MDLFKISMRVAASTIPAYVKVGEAIEKIASRFDELAAEEKETRARWDMQVTELRRDFYGLAESVPPNESNLKRYIEEGLDHVGAGQIPETARILHKLARELTTAKR